MTDFDDLDRPDRLDHIDQVDQIGQMAQVWRDDRLVEALGRREPVSGDDPALGPLLALTRVSDAPLPDRPVDAGDVVDRAHHHRYAVRSLAAALTVVATLSTSGVAAVVTGDPLHPAKAVWEHFRSHTDVARAPDSLLGAPGTGRGYADPDPAVSALAPLASRGSYVRPDGAGDEWVAAADRAAGTSTTRSDAAPPAAAPPDADPAQQPRGAASEPSRADDRARSDSADEPTGEDAREAEDSEAQPSSDAQPDQERQSEDSGEERDSTEPAPLPEPPSTDDPLPYADSEDGGESDGEPTATPLVPPDGVRATLPAEPTEPPLSGEPLPSEPLDTEPLRSGPEQTEPPLQTEPLQTEPLQTEPRADG